MKTTRILSQAVAAEVALGDSANTTLAYLNAALADGQLPSGQAQTMTILRQIALAQGLQAVAQRAGMSQHRLCLALLSKSSPTLRTFLAILRGAGLRLRVSRAAPLAQKAVVPTSAMFRPPHPGVTLREDVLPSLGLSCLDAAQQLGVPMDTLAQVLNGDACISPDMASRLEIWLGAANGAAARLWLAQQQAYDKWQATQRRKASAGEAK